MEVSLSETSVTTSSSGQAQTVFTAESEGRESIITESIACDGSETASAGPTIDIGQNWSGTITMNFYQDTGGAGWIFDDDVTITFDFAVDQGNLTGNGPGFHIMTVTPTDDCWIGCHDKEW